MSILRDIRDYLQTHHQASLIDLSNRFETSPDAMRGMLEQWIAKGKVRQCSPFACGQCSTACSSAPGDSYEWVD